MRCTMPMAAVVLLASVVPAAAEDWVSFPMGEGPDLMVDRSSIQRDTEGKIAPWGRGWMTAKTRTTAGYDKSQGYFVTDCRDLYYVLRVNPKTGSIETEGAQPLHVTAGAVSKQIQSIVCGERK